MIVYDLACANQHRFEGWFASSADFEQQLEGRLLSCPLCGNDNIARLPHAPYFNSGAVQSESPPTKANQQYANLRADLMVKLIDHVLATTEDVGAAFPEEARRIHYGESDERRIRGTAAPEEIDALKEEGIEVVALPIPPHRTGKNH